MDSRRAIVAVSVLNSNDLKNGTGIETIKA
jgi:hypothetical protein